MARINPRQKLVLKPGVSDAAAKKKAAAQKAKKSEADKAYREAKSAERAKAKSDLEAAKGVDAVREAGFTPENLNAPIPTRETADQRAKRLSSYGSIGDEIYRNAPTMRGHLQKQIGRASTRISNNPNHGIALDSIADELNGRIALAGDSSINRDQRLAPAQAHIEAAANMISAHRAAHGRGDAKNALGFLTAAADHLSAAANAVVEKDTRGKRNIGLSRTDTDFSPSKMFSDDWAPGGTRYRDPQDIDARTVSLDHIHDKLTSIVGAYRDHLKDHAPEKAEEALAAIPERKYAANKATPVSASPKIDKRADEIRSAALTRPRAQYGMRPPAGEEKPDPLAVDAKDWEKDAVSDTSKEDVTKGLPNAEVARQQYIRQVQQTAETGSSNAGYPVLPPKGMKIGSPEWEAFSAKDEAPRKTSVIPTAAEKEKLKVDAEARSVAAKERRQGKRQPKDTDLLSNKEILSGPEVDTETTDRGETAESIQSAYLQQKFPVEGSGVRVSRNAEFGTGQGGGR